MRTDIPKSHRRGVPIHSPAASLLSASASTPPGEESGPGLSRQHRPSAAWGKLSLRSSSVSASVKSLPTLMQLPTLLTLLLRAEQPRFVEGVEEVSSRMFSKLMSLWHTPNVAVVVVVHVDVLRQWSGWWGVVSHTGC